MTVKVSGGVLKVEVCSMVKYLNFENKLVSHAWHFCILCYQLQRKNLVDAYLEKKILKLKGLSCICSILYAVNI